MASTYTNLKIELMATGDQPGIWGNTTDQNLTAIQQAIGGLASVVYTTDANKSLTYLSSNADQDFRAMALNLTSTVSLTATRTLVVPAVQKLYLVKNATTGSQSITVKIGSSTGVTIPNGYTQLLYADGSDVVVTSTAEAYLLIGQSTMGPSAYSGSITQTTTVQTIKATNGVIPAVGDPNLTSSLGLVPEGYGAFMLAKPDNTALGGGPRGAYAVDLQLARGASGQVASGDFSVLGGGGNNTSQGYFTVVAGGYNNSVGAVVQGYYGVISGGRSNTAYGGFGCTIAGGEYNAITNSNTEDSVIGGGASNSIALASYGMTIAGGRSNFASGTDGTIGGGNSNVVGHSYATISGGYYAVSRTTGSRNYASGSFSSTAGTAQDGKYVLRVATSNGTATRLTADGGAASGSNSVNLPNNSSYYVKGQVVARNTATGDTKVWTFDGAIKRGANAAATALVAAISSTSVAADAGAAAWTLGVTADTTYGGLAVTGTGAAATAIRWVCTVETVEVVNG